MIVQSLSHQCQNVTADRSPTPRSNDSASELENANGEAFQSKFLEMKGAMIAFYFHFSNMNFSHFFFCHRYNIAIRGSRLLEQCSFPRIYQRTRSRKLHLEDLAAHHDPARKFSDNHRDSQYCTCHREINLHPIPSEHDSIS